MQRRSRSSESEIRRQLTPPNRIEKRSQKLKVSQDVLMRSSALAVLSRLGTETSGNMSRADSNDLLETRESRLKSRYADEGNLVSVYLFG